MRRTAAAAPALALALALALTACGGKKSTHERAACETDSDCRAGQTCMAGKCADWRSKAIYESPETAVKPEDVRKQVERTQEQHQGQIDRAMEAE